MCTKYWLTAKVVYACPGQVLEFYVVIWSDDGMGDTCNTGAKIEIEKLNFTPTRPTSPDKY